MYFLSYLKIYIYTGKKKKKLGQISSSMFPQLVVFEFQTCRTKVHSPPDKYVLLKKTSPQLYPLLHKF